MIVVPLSAYFMTKSYLEKVYYLEEYYSSPHVKENIIFTWGSWQVGVGRMQSAGWSGQWVGGSGQWAGGRWQVAVGRLELAVSSWQ